MGIYIIRAKGGPVKIGFTDQDPHKRIANISTAHWARVELVAFIEGDRKAEKALHRRFSAARIRGEWFDLTPEVEAFIKTCPKPVEKPSKKFAGRGEEYIEHMRSIWFDMSITSNVEAAKKAGVHYQNLKNHFGPSGREGRSAYKARLQAALDTAAKRTGDGRCNADRLFELWGSPADIGEVVSKSGWPQSSIYTHFAKQKITREMARLEMANRRKAKRKSKK